MSADTPPACVFTRRCNILLRCVTTAVLHQTHCFSLSGFMNLQFLDGINNTLSHPSIQFQNCDLSRAMPPQQQDLRSSGIIPGLILIVALILIRYFGLDWIPESLRWAARPIAYWTSYVVTQMFLQSWIGSKLIGVARVCLASVILCS